jgi:hypothetical protein
LRFDQITKLAEDLGIYIFPILAEIFGGRVLWVELRSSYLLGRHSTNRGTSPALSRILREGKKKRK